MDSVIETINENFVSFNAEKEKIAPKNLKECLKRSALEENLWTWAHAVQATGFVLAALFVVCWSVFCLLEGGAFWDYLLALVVAALGVIVICLPFYTTALLIGSLASIVQNTKISANIAMLNAAREERMATSRPQNPTPQSSYNNKGESKKGTPEMEVQPESTKEKQPKNQDGSEWKCSFCGTFNHSTYWCKCGADKVASKTREEFMNKGK